LKDLEEEKKIHDEGEAADRHKNLHEASHKTFALKTPYENV